VGFEEESNHVKGEFTKRERNREGDMFRYIRKWRVGETMHSYHIEGIARKLL